MLIVTVSGTWVVPAELLTGWLEVVAVVYAC